jgi:OOP family OmpA-OmpF porin
LVLMVLFYNQTLFAQEPSSKSKDDIIYSYWLVGLGINVVDDSNNGFSDFLSVKDTWNSVPYPSRISIGQYFDNGLGIEAIISINTYKAGKIINDTVNTEESSYFGLDGRISYDLNKLLKKDGWFNPYVGVGGGITSADNFPRGTYNASIGVRTWFTSRLALDLSTTGKWPIKGYQVSSHLQHAIGLSYKFGIQRKPPLRNLPPKEALKIEVAKVTDTLSKEEIIDTTQLEQIETRVTEREKALQIEEFDASNENKSKPGLRFKVQVMALTRNVALDNNIFKALENLSIETSGPLYRYVHGDFNTYAEANRYKIMAIEKGYPTSFVVPYKDGVRISILEAIEYLLD